MPNLKCAQSADEVHALKAENSAGESTLMKMLSGADNPDPAARAAFCRRFFLIVTRQAKAMQNMIDGFDLATRWPSPAAPTVVYLQLKGIPRKRPTR